MPTARLADKAFAAPAYASVCIRFDVDRPPDARALLALIERSLGRHDCADPSAAIDIPVCYGGEFGPDIADVAAHTKLTIDEVSAHHCAATYTVAMLGFMPGFPYLRGLPSHLVTPRRATPRTRVRAGSVAIGGAQTGIDIGGLLELRRLLEGWLPGERFVGSVARAGLPKTFKHTLSDERQNVTQSH